MKWLVSNLSLAHAPFTIGVMVWLTSTVVGFSYLAVYSYTPGQLAAPTALDSSVVLSTFFNDSSADSRFKLVMAIHPRCPCTRASLEELTKLITKCGEELSCSILVYRPADASEDWHDSDTVATARSLPQTRVVLDDDGQLAKKFQLKTSGAVVLYADNDEAVFYGGLTASRGHQGDNLGCDAVLSLVRHGFADRAHCPVYGCAIERPNTKGQATEALR